MRAQRKNKDKSCKERARLVEQARAHRDKRRYKQECKECRHYAMDICTPPGFFERVWAWIIGR